MRRLWLLLIAVSIAVFLAISALLARTLSVDGAERSAITELVQAEARGDTGAMLAKIRGCGASAPCLARVTQDVAALRVAGPIAILQLQPSAGITPTGSIGTARVAWKGPATRPIVQCVRVRRSGNAVRGLRVELLEISPRIKTDSNCPHSF